MASQITTLAFQMNLLEGNQLSRDEAEVDDEVAAGRRAVDLWNNRFDTNFTLSEFPNIKAPINSSTLYDVAQAYEEVTGQPFTAGLFSELAQAPMVELLNQQNPDWVLQIGPERDAPYTEAEAQALRDQALQSARDADAANGRDVVIPVDVWNDILSGTYEQSSNTDFTVPGLLGDVVPV